jgi:serine/threonine-protein kinase RsbW
VTSHLVELRLPPDPQLVGLARLVVVTAARRAGMDEERVEDLRIAVSEATTNAILAHSRGGSDDRVLLRFGATADEKGFTVLVADSGSGFDPSSPEDLATRAWSEEGGLGVTLIRGLADEVQFTRGGDGMDVSLQFQVSLTDPR